MTLEDLSGMRSKEMIVGGAHHNNSFSALLKINKFKKSTIQSTAKDLKIFLIKTVF